MVERLDLVGEGVGDDVADHGHEPLEKAERPRELDAFSPFGMAHQNAAAHGYRERVHRQAHRQQEQGNEIH